MDDWKLKTTPVVRLQRAAMGNKRICGCADVATGKRRIKCADAKCGCLGKTRMCGCQFFAYFSSHGSCLVFIH